jgi:PAS domain S-box-containing protein
MSGKNAPFDFKSYLLKVTAVAAAYLGAAKLSMLLATVPGNITLLWPPAGIALAALLLWSSRMAPAVLLGAFLAAATTGAPWPFSILAALGNTLAALTGFWLLRWRGFDNTLGRVRDVVDLVLWGGLAASLVSATSGALGLAAGGMIAWGGFWPAWLTCWLGDSMGVILVAPVILAWFSRPAFGWRSLHPAEGAAWLALFGVIGMVVFSGWTTPAMADALDFLPFPLLLWAALRFGRRLTSTASLLLCYVALIAAAQGVGPLADEPAQKAFFLLWFYLGTLSVGALCLAISLGQTRRALDALSDHRDRLARAVSRRTAQMVAANQELRAASQFLREEKEHFRSLTEKLPLGLALVSREGIYKYVNPAFTKIFGYTLADIPTGRDWFQRAFPDPARRKKAVRAWRDELSKASVGQGRSRSFEVACLDGAVKVVELRTVTLGNGDWLVLYEDVSERERAAQALRASEEKHRALFAGANDAIFLMKDYRFIECNPKTLEMFACRREDIIGRTPLAYSPHTQPGGGDSRRLALERMDAALAGQPQFFEWRHLRGNGEPFDAEVSLNCLELEGEAHILAMVRDVTERKKAQLALAESEEKFSKLFRHSPVWVVLATLEEGRYLEVNQAFLDQTGWTREEVIGRTAADLSIRPDPTERNHVIQSIRQQGAVHNLEVKRRTKDGRILTMLYSGDIIEVGGKEYLLSLVQDITERKSVERALKASEEKFSKLYMASPVWMSLSSVEEGRYLEVNQAFEQVTGYSRREVVGRTSLELGMWPDPGQRRKIVDKLAQEGALHQFPVTFRVKSGELRDFLWSAEVVNIDDEPVLISVLLDVTDLHQAQQALAESEQSFRTVVENSLAGIYVIQGDKWVYVNPRLVQMLGYDSADELVGRQPWDFVHPEDRERVKSLGGGREKGPVGTDHYIFRALRKDGGVVWLETMGTHATYRNRPANVGNVIDITQRKIMEQALKDREEQYRLLVNNAQDAIYIIQDERIVFSNPTTGRITGYSPEELRQKPFDFLLHPEDREMVVSRHLACLRGGDVPANYPHRIITKGGREIWLQISPVVIKYQGRPAVMVIARDITEQRRMEAQLRQSQKLEALGTLAGGIAHDFNNILAAIMGYAELSLEDTPAGGQVAGNLKQVLAACKRARDLVRQILSFSRHGKQELQPLLMEPLVKEVLSLIRATTPSHIEIISELEPGGVIRADPVQIHQLLMNLCSNAAQAMEDSGGTIRVSLSRINLAPGDEAASAALPPGPYLRLSVEDTGPGIPPDIKDRIFEPFFTTKDPGRGSGLGLSAVHGIAQGHQGAVSLEDLPGGGTVFHVLLPENDMAPDQAEEPPAPPITTGHERVMFVDDEPALAEIARNMLQRLGYQVSTFTSSQQALAAFQEDPRAFDLIITDQTMPGLTGAALAREVKNLRPEIPVIICTGFSHQLGPEQARKLGVSAFVMKPITSGEIARVVRGALDGPSKTMSE